MELVFKDFNKLLQFVSVAAHKSLSADKGKKTDRVCTGKNSNTTRPRVQELTRKDLFKRHVERCQRLYGGSKVEVISLNLFTEPFLCVSFLTFSSCVHCFWTLSMGRIQHNANNFQLTKRVHVVC